MSDKHTDVMYVVMVGWLTTNMIKISKDKIRFIKKWLVIQKVTLGRGYGWLQVPMIGFIAASQFKLLFPTFFDGIDKFILLVIGCTLGLWTVGYMDKKMELLHDENAYGTETNPRLMEMLNNTRDKKQ